MRVADLRWSVEFEISADELAELLLACVSRKENKCTNLWWRLRGLHSESASDLYERLRALGSEPVRVLLPRYDFEGVKIALTGIVRPSNPGPLGPYRDDVNLTYRKQIWKKIEASHTKRGPTLSVAEPEESEGLDACELELLG